MVTPFRATVPPQTRETGRNPNISRILHIKAPLPPKKGLPETWRPEFEAGTFKLQALPKVLPNVRLYKGWFKDSLPVFKRDHPGWQAEVESIGYVPDNEQVAVRIKKIAPPPASDPRPK